MADERFPPEYRLHHPREFARVYEQKNSASDGVLVIHAAVNNLPHSRLGMAVSRRVGKAVTRQRWKRLIREAFRRQRERFPSGIDFVVAPRRGATPEAAAVAASFVKLANRLGRRR